MTKFVERDISAAILAAQPYYPVTLITGPRQSGKSTLCCHLFSDYNFANLEDLDAYSLAISDPVMFLNSLGKHAIIDEVQRVPQLLNQIQANVDANPSLRYILTGSSNFALMHNACQSLAGRAADFTLLPFSFRELGEEWLSQPTDTLMFDGLYPGVVVNQIPAPMFYRNYISTYVQRDVRDLLKVANLGKFTKFLQLMAGRVSSEFNATAISNEVGVSSNTVSEWCSILETAYIIFPVRPYYANIAKRLSKMPKIYFHDTGLACHLLGIETAAQLATHPLRGALFENMAMAEMIKRPYNAGKEPHINFYRENSGREVDILVTRPEGVEAYEVKSGMTFNADYLKNLRYLADTLPTPPISQTVIYDGTTREPSLLNIRKI